MTHIGKQAKTLLLLVATSAKLGAAARSAISDELKEVINVGSMQPLRRRRLLAAIHTARGLETSLREVVAHHGLTVVPNRRNMGGYLSALASQSIIPQKIRADCDGRVRVLRNRLAHGAGEYPAGDHQLNSAAQAAHTCMALIL